MNGSGNAAVQDAMDAVGEKTLPSPNDGILPKPETESSVVAGENPHSFECVQVRHEALLRRALLEGRALATDSDESAEFLRKAEELLRDMDRLSALTDSFEDYWWLSEAAVKWQVIFSSALNLPKTVQLSLPRNLLPPQPPRTTLSDEEIDHWLKRNAEYFAFVRIAKTRLMGSISSEGERSRDAYLARVFFASDVLDGKINFASRIAPASYWRLEEAWINDIKLLRSYFLWERRGNSVDPIQEKADYFNACDGLRSMLVNAGIKAKLPEFSPVQQYIEERLLTNGKLLSSKDAARRLIERKAHRIAEITGETDAFGNWVSAETYATMFYENIIGAVADDDTEKVLMVLKAFQYSRAGDNSWWVINAFEAALVMYFVRSETIRLLWTKSAGNPVPESSIQSSVAVPTWSAVGIPSDCVDRFWYDGRRILFKGVMTETQLKSLLATVSTSTEEQKLLELYHQSRVIREEMTL